MDDEVKRLREEVAALRAGHTRLAVLGGLLALGLVAVVIADRLGGSGDLVARTVEIEDEAGVKRASLGTTALGEAALTLYDKGGNKRVSVRAADAHGTLEITDAGQRVQVRLSAIENLSGLHLANGSRSAQMTASTETTSLTLVDLDDSLSAVLRAEPDGTDLQLSRNKTGEPPRLASLSAGGADPEKGASVTIAGPQQFLQGTVHPSDGEPRLVIAGETRVESRTGADETLWQRFERAPEPTPR